MRNILIKPRILFMHSQKRAHISGKTEHFEQTKYPFAKFRTKIPFRTTISNNNNNWCWCFSGGRNLYWKLNALYYKKREYIIPLLWKECLMPAINTYLPLISISLTHMVHTYIRYTYIYFASFHLHFDTMLSLKIGILLHFYKIAVNSK